MRILHTADWHFGKTLDGRDRMAEQRAVIHEMAEICRAEAIDVVLMAGDVFQTVNPSAQAEQLYYEALDSLSDGGTRGLIVIAGNHDNPERISAARPLAEPRGITLLGLPKSAADATERLQNRAYRVRGGVGYFELAIPTASETLMMLALPYPSESRISEVLSETLDERTLREKYNARLESWFAERAVHFRDDTVNIAMSHLYIRGGVESESEVQIQIGGAYAVDASVFPDKAQYVALGHLHRPQDVRDARMPIRYAGSPLAYSFSEASQEKSVTILEVHPGQPAMVKTVPLKSGRPLVRWVAQEGLHQVYTWLDEGRDRDAWIDLSVHVRSGLEFEEIHRLRTLREGIVQIRPVLTGIPDEQAVAEEANRISRTLEEHFVQFYLERNGVPPDDTMVKLFLALASETRDVDGIRQEEESA
ncbi:exonuclease SbcCD subunit D [Ferroacidibacillus organovorans]|uniref:Nuclease SbcCD subunit D n=1 Tax=Ferroacidibacillus organovorans TaxID=1765683 RepID=A0A101XR80_9BACL|nr:exonuclease subunit SbcD [Ferroacidibacillus organovorans]KUO96062.1 exonuclease sbcCD subunit D [Ferroacidibacillus organovorans]